MLCGQKTTSTVGRYYMDTSKRSRSMRMPMQHRGDGRRGKRQDRATLIDILCKFNNCDPYYLGTNLRYQKAENLEYIQSLGPLFTIFNKNDLFTINDITYSGANRLLCFRQHRCKANVEQYYFIKHKITLDYPFLPCLVVYGNRGHISFYPIELLQVADLPALEKISIVV